MLRHFPSCNVPSLRNPLLWCLLKREEYKEDSSRSVQADWEVLLFDIGAVYPGKLKSEGSESFQGELQMLSEESERTSPHFLLFYSPQSRLCNPGGLLRSIFAGYVPLASQSPYPIIVYFGANYRPLLSHF